MRLLHLSSDKERHEIARKVQTSELPVNLPTWSVYYLCYAAYGIGSLCDEDLAKHASFSGFQNILVGLAVFY